MNGNHDSLACGRDAAMATAMDITTPARPKGISEEEWSQARDRWLSRQLRHLAVAAQAEACQHYTALLANKEARHPDPAVHQPVRKEIALARIRYAALGGKPTRNYFEELVSDSERQQAETLPEHLALWRGGQLAQAAAAAGLSLPGDADRTAGDAPAERLDRSSHPAT